MAVGIPIHRTPRAQSEVRCTEIILGDVMLIIATCGGEWAITSDNVAYWAAIVAIVLTLMIVALSLFRRNFSWAPVYGTLLLLHPAWTMELGSDCGFAKRFLSVAVCLVLIAILVLEGFGFDVSKRRFVFVLGVLAWIGYFLAFPLIPWPSWMPHGDPNGGLLEQTINSLSSAGEMKLAPIAIVLSAIWVLQGFISQILYRSREGTPHSKNIVSASHNVSELKLRPVTLYYYFKVLLRAFALVVAIVFLGFSILYLCGLFVYGFAFTYVTTFAACAFGWGILLIMVAVRGRFPGWELRNRD